MEKIKGKIEDAKIYRILDIWKRKPKGVNFSDTDAVVVTVKAGGKTIKKTFYCCIKASGKISLTQITKRATARQRKLADFIRKYITKDVKNYNIKQGIKEWKGKTVEVLRDKDVLFIS